MCVLGSFGVVKAMMDGVFSGGFLIQSLEPLSDLVDGRWFWPWRSLDV